MTPETRAKLPAMIDPGLAPENPLDVGPVVGVQPPKFAEICKVVCADPTVDLVTVQGLMPVNPGDPYDPEPLRGVRASTDKPILAFGRIAQNVSDISRKFQSETGVPFIQGLPETVRALQGLVRYAATLRRGVAPMAEPRGRADNLAGAAFDALLATHGLTPPQERARQDAGRGGRAGRPHRLSGGGEDRLAGRRATRPRSAASRSACAMRRRCAPRPRP